MWLSSNGQHIILNNCLAWYSPSKQLASGLNMRNPDLCRGEFGIGLHKLRNISRDRQVYVVCIQIPGGAVFTVLGEVGLGQQPREFDKVIQLLQRMKASNCMDVVRIL